MLDEKIIFGQTTRPNCEGGVSRFVSSFFAWEYNQPFFIEIVHAIKNEILTNKSKRLSQNIKDNI